MNKYFKPKSLTWWVSVAPLFIGLFMAFEPVHGYEEWVTSLETASGFKAPALINFGLAGIGLRGAVGDSRK